MAACRDCWRLRRSQARRALSEQAQRLALVVVLRPKLPGLSGRFRPRLLFGQVEVDGVREETGGEWESVSCSLQVAIGFSSCSRREDMKLKVR